MSFSHARRRSYKKSRSVQCPAPLNPGHFKLFWTRPRNPFTIWLFISSLNVSRFWFQRKHINFRIFSLSEFLWVLITQFLVFLDIFEETEENTRQSWNELADYSTNLMFLKTVDMSKDLKFCWFLMNAFISAATHLTPSPANCEILLVYFSSDSNKTRILNSNIHLCNLPPHTKTETKNIIA